MSLRSLMTHRVTVKRPAAAAGIRKTYKQVYTDIACLIEPLDPEALRQFDTSFAATHQCFMLSAQDIREGDQLVDQESRTFYVRGVRLRNYGRHPHKQLLLGEDKGN